VRIPAAADAPGALERQYDSLAEAQAAGYTVIDIREPNEIAEEPLAGTDIV